MEKRIREEKTKKKNNEKRIKNGKI